MTPEPTVAAECLEALAEFSGKLEHQSRIHAKAVKVIAEVIGDDDILASADGMARAILAELSAAGLLVGEASEFKE